MKLTTYFIKHPVISIVLNGLIVLVGLLSFYLLPVREYPNIIFPEISVDAFYPNASAELVETSVTSVLEDQLAGVEGVELMTSSSDQAYSSITLKFRPNVSMDRALMATKDAVSLAQPKLPKEMKEPAVKRRQSSNTDIFMAVSVEGPPSKEFAALTHFANVNLKNALRSIRGVADVEVEGERYTYAITLDPKKMVMFGVNADEVAREILNNSISLPAGQFREQVPVMINAELKKDRDYENILIKENKQHPVFLKSLAKVQLKGSEDDARVRINGNPGILLVIFQSNDANALEVSNAVHQEIRALGQNLPSGYKMHVVLDKADFIRASIKNIRSAILEALILVLGVVFLFLRNFRATLIPAVTIPVSLLGGLIFLKFFGFSINIITLLAIVLAVGLVVDDAIVVLENIARHVEHGLAPLDAAILGAREIGFAIVAMTLTLTSVYAPVAFVPGLIGQFFIEFAVALAGSVLFSGVVALTLSPLMCAYALKHDSGHAWPQVDQFLNRLTEKYRLALAYVMQRKKIALLAALASLGLMLLFFKMLPGEIAPSEDRGFIGASIQPAPDEKLDTLEQKVAEVEKKLRELPEAGDSLSFVSKRNAFIALSLKPLSERKRSAKEMTETIRPELQSFPSMDVYVRNFDSGLPGIEKQRGAGSLQLVISTTESYRDLFNTVEKLQQKVDESKLFQQASHDLSFNGRGFSIDLDTNMLSKLGLTSKQVAKTVEIFFSGDRSMNFQKDGVSYPITLKGENSPWTLDELYLSNAQGKRISLGAVATMNFKTQPGSLNRHNQMRSATFSVALKPGQTVEEAMPKFLNIAKDVLTGAYKTTWSGMAKAYQESSRTMLVLFILALMFIYAILAMQFENFTDPFIILFTVPLACSGALFVVWLFSQSINIYTQVGLITLVGLITKHGILIVEFANQLHKEGFSYFDAVQKASVLRLRPILMTTGAMVFGAVPLVLSHDAGAEARRAIGSVLVGGLCVGTLFTLFVLPSLYYLVKSRQRSPTS